MFLPLQRLLILPSKQAYSFSPLPQIPEQTITFLSPHVFMGYLVLDLLTVWATPLRLILRLEAWKSIAFLENPFQALVQRVFVITQGMTLLHKQ